MDNGFERGRQKPYPLVEDGKGYNRLLLSRSQAILNALNNLLASNYESAVVGPNYTLYLKAMATELARITIILDQLGRDVSPEEVRSEFLWDTVGYLVFLNQNVPDLEFDDESFRKFLTKVIEIYFEGSTPEAIRKGVELFTSDTFRIRENFKEDTDISEQFGFGIDFELQGQFPSDLFTLDKNIRLLLEIIRPAHTLYKLRNLFTDTVDIVDSATDASSWAMQDYHYDDVRRYCAGMAGFSSDTGRIDSNSLYVLVDEGVDKPLHNVRENTTLLIPEGPNSGRYTVVGHPTTNSVSIFPRFKVGQDPVSYHVEVDRLGKKKETFRTDALGWQTQSLDRLVVDGEGPYSVASDSTITLEASSNGVGPTFEWDLDGSNQFSTEGVSVPFTAPSTGGTVIVWVRVTDYRGRRAKAPVSIEVS